MVGSNRFHLGWRSSSPGAAQCPKPGPLTRRHIIGLYAAWEDEKAYYLVQEYASGGDLFMDLENSGGKMSESRAVREVVAPYLEVRPPCLRGWRRTISSRAPAATLLPSPPPAPLPPPLLLLALQGLA